MQILQRFALVSRRNIERLAVLGYRSSCDNDTLFTERLSKHIRQAIPEIEIQPPHLPPVAGAVLEAFKLQQNRIPVAFIKRLQASL